MNNRVTFKLSSIETTVWEAKCTACKYYKRYVLFNESQNALTFRASTICLLDVFQDEDSWFAINRTNLFKKKKKKNRLGREQRVGHERMSPVGKYKPKPWIWNTLARNWPIKVQSLTVQKKASFKEEEDEQTAWISNVFFYQAHLCFLSVLFLCLYLYLLSLRSLICNLFCIHHIEGSGVSRSSACGSA